MEGFPALGACFGMMDLLHFEIERGKYKAVTSTLTQIGLRDNLRMGTM